MSDQVTSTDQTRRRAERYVRWFPRAWRDRYEVEFVAHLEAEIAERPRDRRRAMDIALHGVVAHASFEANRRRTVLSMVMVTLVGLVTIVAVTAGRYFAPLAITPGSQLATESIGLPTTSSQVNDLAYIFNAPAKARVTISSVRLLPVRGFAVPTIVGVALADRVNASDLLNARSWPPRIPTLGRQFVQEFTTRAVMDRSVTLGHHNTMWIGLRTPRNGVAYASDGLVLTYEMHGVGHTVTLSKSSMPDVLYVDPSPNSAAATTRLDDAMQDAGAIAGAFVPSLTPVRVAVAVATVVSDEALNTRRRTTVQTFEAIATHYFPAINVDGVRRVAFVGGASPHWRLTITDTARRRSVDVCVTSQVLDRRTGLSSGVGQVPC